MNSWKLYYASGACSFVPHTLLEAAGATFEPLPVKLHRNEQQALVRQAQQARGADAWLSGAAFGPLDSYALALTRWGSMVGIDPRAPPALWAFIEERVAAHPPVARVLERERVPLNLDKPA